MVVTTEEAFTVGFMAIITATAGVGADRTTVPD